MSGWSLPGTAGDDAVSLPAATAGAASAELPTGLTQGRHLLLLADDVTAEEVESLALCLDEHAGWVGARRLQLLPGAQLLGPWPAGSALSTALSLEPGADDATVLLPDWVRSLMVLDCPPQRLGRLPEELAGRDPVADAFPLAQPAGTELVALTSLRAIAWRLAGALLLAGEVAGDGEASSSPHGQQAAGRPYRRVLVEPDPSEPPDLTVYAPVWLAPDACQAVLSRELGACRVQVQALAPEGLDIGPGRMPAEDLARLTTQLGAGTLDAAWRQAREQINRSRTSQEPEVLAGYAVAAPVRSHGGTVREGWGQVEVRVEPADWLPLAVRGEPWAQDGAVTYQVVWSPQDPADRDPARRTRSRLAEREAAARMIEAATGAVREAAGGVVVDAAGFLVSL